MKLKALILLAGLSVGAVYAVQPISLTVSDFGQNSAEAERDWQPEITAIEQAVGAPVNFSIAPSNALSGDIIYVSKASVPTYEKQGYKKLGQAVRLGVDGKPSNQITDMLLFNRTGTRITALKDLQGKSVGVVGKGDETSGKTLQDTLSAQSIQANFISFSNYREALDALKAGKVVGVPVMRYKAQKTMNEAPGSFAVISFGSHEAGYLMAKGLPEDKFAALKAVLAKEPEGATGYHTDVHYYA